jgi:hypothetical protein
VFVTGYGREGLPQAFNSDVYMQNGRTLAAALANAWSVAPGLLIIIAQLVRYIGRPKPCWTGIEAIAVNPIKRAIFQLDLDSPAPAVI